MPQIKAREAAAMDAADETAARMSDESAMDNLLGDLEAPGGGTPPTEQPAAGTPSPTDPPSLPTKPAEGAPPAAAPKTEATPPATKTDEQKAKEEDDALEAEIDAQLKDLPQLPPNASEHSKKAMKAMKAALKEQKRELKKAVAENALTAAEREQFRTKLQEIGDLKPEEINDIRLRKRIEQGERDPEFIAKYIEPIKAAETEAMTLLTSLKLPPDISDWINEEGGLVAFYQSNKPVLDEKGAPVRGPGGVVLTQSEWFRRNVLDNPQLTAAQRDDIRDQVTTARSMIKARDKALQDLSKEGKEAETAAEQKKQQRIESVRESYGKTVETLAEKLGPAAQFLTPKDDATAEVKALIQRHNDRVTKGKAVVDMVNNEILLAENRDTPEYAARMGEVAFAAAQAEFLAEVNVEYQNRIQKLEADLKAANDKITKMKGSRETVRLENAPPPNSETTAKPPTGSDDEKAMGDLMSTLP